MRACLAFFIMIKEFRQNVVGGKASAREIASQYLKNAKELNKEYNSFVSFCDALALESAARIDKKVSEKKPLGKLAGVPIAIKDNMLVKDFSATAGSKMLEHYVASFDADAVKFLRDEDALIIGKTNMDEFAMGSSSETSHFGPVKNNVGKNLVPGGSSGGSAVAVASGQVIAALGSDTGGSIRQPASFTGTVGLKPTYGRVSRSGLIAMASSLDQIGTFTTSVEDCALLLEVISQDTDFDATYARKTFHWPQLDKKEILQAIAQVRIGVPDEFFGEGLSAEIARAVRGALEMLEHAGAQIIPLSLPCLEYALACYYVLMPAEVSSNLARYDCIRYSPVEVEKMSTTIHDYDAVRSIGFGKEVQRRIMLGTYVLSSGYVDKYYLEAQKARTKILQDFSDAFLRVDIIAGPVSPTFPFGLGEKINPKRINDPVSMYLADIYTVAVNLAGLPAISLPLPGLKLPAGIQFIAGQFAEEQLLRAARGYEEIILS